jgi:tRNA(fMet)-specific endonuclease VapC
VGSGEGQRASGRSRALNRDSGHSGTAADLAFALPVRYGAAKRGSRRLTRQVETVLGAITILSLEAGADRHYAAIRIALEKKGTPIDAHDMLIAAQARAIEAVCVTDNVAEFKRVPALKIENWLA